jgi:hypothetical protein
MTITGEMIPVTIAIRQNNDAVLTAYLTDPTLPLINGQQQPLNMTGKTAAFIRKSSRDTPDADASFRSYAGAVQGAPTLGVVAFTIPLADNAVAGVTWWRIDVTSSGKVVTAQYGPLQLDPT